MSEFRVDKITNRTGDTGPQIAGISTFSGTSGMAMPSGPTEHRGGRGRGVFAGGNLLPAMSNSIDYVTIATTGNAADFGDLTASRTILEACSSSTRGVWGGGSPNGDRLDYVNIMSTGDAVDFGNITARDEFGAACSNGHGGLG